MQNRLDADRGPHGDNPENGFEVPHDVVGKIPVAQRPHQNDQVSSTHYDLDAERLGLLDDARCGLDFATWNAADLSDRIPCSSPLLVEPQISRPRPQPATPQRS